MGRTLPNTQLSVSQKPVPDRQLQTMQNASLPHLDSFNFMLKESVPRGVGYMERHELEFQGERISFWVQDALISRPSAGRRDAAEASRALYPWECRERRVTYQADLQLNIHVQVGENPVWTINKIAGQIPIMVKSDRCYLKGLTPAELVHHHEEAQEMGGYFIINGNEKIIRMLLLPRRNFPMAIRRNFSKKGPMYTDYCVQMRCVRDDQTAQTVYLHYLNDGTCNVGFAIRKTQYFVPAILFLRALVDGTDKSIYNALVQVDKTDTFTVERALLMLGQYSRERMYSQATCLAFLGRKFRVVLDLPEWVTDEEAGRTLIRRILFIHLEDEQSKFECMIVMVRKLLAFVSGKCAEDNQDANTNHEVLTSGFLYGNYLKEQISEYLLALKRVIQKDIVRTPSLVSFADSKYFRKLLGKSPDIGRKMEYLLSTGNLLSPTGLDLMQATGFSIVADKLNFLRYLSHFRCIHRGAFFAEMKTTSVRKLLPEGFGFLCPVHTPDGAPCGLLNHLAAKCEVSTGHSDTSRVPGVLKSLGLVPVAFSSRNTDLVVMLDGKVMGFLPEDIIVEACAHIRILKSQPDSGVPATLEVALVLPTERGQFPGLFLFSTPSRMIRPVRNLRTNGPEYIGSFEQAYMDIAVTKTDYIEGKTTHMEEAPTNMLSIVANMVPFSDFNQSPRNMYQCQMGKQTMGFPLHAYPYRSDNKLYCLHTPQTPIVRSKAYDAFGLDTYPTGTNAIVAVISYTGYDMEDAMILNKSSHERGFAAAHVATTKVIDLSEYREPGQPITHHFGKRNRDPKAANLDKDGLPYVGSKLKTGDPLYCVINDTTGQARVEKYKGEDAIVLQVSLLGLDTPTEAQRASIKLYINRNPIIGDKFASRHGQKGILSRLWPQEDMPFAESGMVPDIIFNPHGFPSRMTIGMLIESMAGKSGAMHGVAHDCTPFQFNENDTAIDYFGKQLRQAGYNYFGHERFYSGITGMEFEADIFMGVVYYQRLRHMVSDKYQVRTTGPVNNLTHQPVKGRKRAGGIRFGEMERDSLLGHGTAFLLQDRLFNCSDRCETTICALCGSLMSSIMEQPSVISKARRPTCRTCGTERGITTVALPYVFRYLTAELLAMNIKLTLDVGSTVTTGP